MIIAGQRRVRSQSVSAHTDGSRSDSGFLQLVVPSP